MIEEILPDLYRIEVPLPGNPLKAINSYVVKDNGHTLIIDTGMNRQECMSVLSAGLKELCVDLNKADFFVTHLHADHLGLVPTLATETSVVYFNQPDADAINSGSLRAGFKDFCAINGFPEDELRRAFHNHPGNRYRPSGTLDYCIVKEGDIISIGNYQFRCIETPGHSEGHMCLYEPKKKALISGDHILTDITPNISLWTDDWDPLDEYLKSLDKVYNLDVEILLPGHRSISPDCKARIQELKKHHETRANEVLSILEKGRLNAYQIAAQMSWDLSYRSWEQFPSQQKWFATGEAIAHLKYLEGKGRIHRELEGKQVLYSLKQAG